MDRLPLTGIRADSWICAAAIHSSLISRTLGGCVAVQTLPYPAGSSNFTGSTSSGLTSVPFAPGFPGAFTLTRLSTPGCLDLHPIVSAFNALMLFLVTLFLLPSPPVLFSTLLILGYGQIVFFSDPAYAPPDWEWVFSGLLPVLFTGYWAYRVAFKRTISAFAELPFELALWQGLGFWIGVENSTIFARLPISRLGYGTLDPGGVIALVVIICMVVVVVLFQAWDMRKFGLLQYYLVRCVQGVPSFSLNPQSPPLSSSLFQPPTVSTTLFQPPPVHSRITPFLYGSTTRIHIAPVEATP